MGNGVAYTALIVWPLIAIYLYKTRTIQQATLWTIVGGFMFLPVRTAIDFPMIPPLEKNTIPVISALFGCWLVNKHNLRYFSDLRGVKYLVILLITVPFITAALNSDAVYNGGRFLPGISYYDGISTVVNQFLIIMPFFIGRSLFKTYAHQLLMFRFLVAAGLLYSIPMLLEVRLSPQLHVWVYGFFPHSFLQQMRFDGFRPVVFMGHGLLVSFFTAIALISAVTLWESKVKSKKIPASMVSYYLLVILLLCKSLASLLYGAGSFLIIKIIKPNGQHKIAVALVCLAMLYPIMSITKTVPQDTLVNIAVSMDDERAESLIFRFDNENTLLEHGRERFFFGWGGWGRNRVFDENGGEKTVTDGRWIITFGQFGIFGFIAEFGLLAVAVLRAKKASKLLKDRSEQLLLSSHALIVGLIMLDQLPNASLSPWLWLITGILLGRSEEIILSNKRSRI
ncbi:MAG: hypothetical protein COA90_08535 [Gammaproteobacteria bacterium]|nr:MAG: hypothetical protein COA90_08535 [Gammaproteobacteria bacterium]